MLNEVTSVLLWDGSTSGYLAPSAAVSKSDYLDINTSLRAATVFARCINDSKCQRFLDFKEEVERQGYIPGYLYGSPLVVTSAPSDQLTASRLKDLKPGMWVRFRNLHIDKPAVERIILPFSSTAPSSSASTPPNTDRSTSTTISSDDAHKIATKLNSWIVGTVHSDTHISLMLPYYK